MNQSWISAHCVSCIHGLVVGTVDGAFRSATCHFERRKMHQLPDDVDQRRRDRSGRDIFNMSECPDRARVAREAELL